MANIPHVVSVHNIFKPKELGFKIFIPVAGFRISQAGMGKPEKRDVNLLFSHYFAKY